MHRAVKHSWDFNVRQNHPLCFLCALLEAALKGNPREGRGSESKSWSLCKPQGSLPQSHFSRPTGPHSTRQREASAMGRQGCGQGGRGDGVSLFLRGFSLCLSFPFSLWTDLLSPATKSQSGWATDTQLLTHKPHEGLMLTMHSHFFL